MSTRPAKSPAQRSLFAAAPPGLAFREEFISDHEEAALLAQIASLEFRPFEFHGWTGNRETVSFGWRYDFSHARVERAPAIPDFLLPLRERAAAFAGLAAGATGTGIGDPLRRRRRHRLASRSAGIRPGVRAVAVFSVRAALSPPPCRQLRALFARCAAALGLSTDRRDPPRMGTQHRADGSDALLDHVSQPEDVHDRVSTLPSRVVACVARCAIGCCRGRSRRAIATARCAAARPARRRWRSRPCRAGISR